MSVASLITLAKGAGTVAVGASATFPVLRFSEAVTVDGAAGANGRQIVRRVIAIDSMAVAGSESAANVGALKDALVADLAARGSAVSIVERGGTARVLRAGGDVSGISGAGTTTRTGYPVTGVVFDTEKSVGAVVFFTLNIETVEGTFAAAGGGAASGYNLEHATESVDIDEDEQGLLSTRVKGSVTLKPGQDAAAYVEAVILAGARTAALGAGQDFTARRTRPDLDASRCDYEYTRKPPNFGDGGYTTSTTIDETDVLRATVEGRRVRTISGTVTGPSAYTTAQDRALSPVPDNHVLTAERLSQPGSLSGAVTYEYEYLTGREGSGALAGTYFFSFTQSVTDAGGGRGVIAATFDNVPPAIGFGPLLPVAYTETTDFEFTGSGGDYPDPDDIPRASGLDADDEASRRVMERRATAPGLRAMRLTRTYLLAEALSEDPVPAEGPGGGA